MVDALGGPAKVILTLFFREVFGNSLARALNHWPIEAKPTKAN